MLRGALRPTVSALEVVRSVAAISNLLRNILRPHDPHVTPAVQGIGSRADITARLLGRNAGRAYRCSRNCDREIVLYRPYLCTQGLYQKFVRKVAALRQGCAVGVRRRRGWRKNASLLAHPSASIGHPATGESEGRERRKASKSAASGVSAAASSAGGRIITCRDASIVAHICAIDATMMRQSKSKVAHDRVVTEVYPG
jgi:hypothetical protein